MKKPNITTNIARVSTILQVIGSESRLKIILAIGAGEACVCHLEAVLGQRQAYISQQLMALRDAGLLNTRREGKYIFYSLAKPDILELFQSASRIAGVDLVNWGPDGHEDQCACPDCSPAISTLLPFEHAH